jgi:EAL domain-containing protein (putative c-di-GMP-specific phosphodiesterase class I)
LRIAVDDVGAGYASLRHVLLLRPDFIKIDASLTQQLARHALTTALIDFAARSGHKPSPKASRPVPIGPSSKTQDQP